ncbi:MAG: lamin tail domain-containing protein, partial [Patescibacteria group bacterium]
NIENPLTKDYPMIYINEILPDPNDDAENNEFIELYNPNEEAVSLKNWQLRDGSKGGKYTFSDEIIEQQSYFTLYRTDFSFALNNSTAEKVSLIAPNTKTISNISYDKARGGVSLNRAKSWYWAESTPNAKNALDPRTLSYPTLLLNEILPNPSGEENTDEYIEIYNPNNSKVNLKNWTLKDASKTGSYTFTDDVFVSPRSFATIYRKDFRFALNNSSETVSLIAPNEKVMSKTSYVSAREDISYNYNFSSKNWRWSKHLTPGNQNVFNNLPEITKFDIDDESYRDVYAEFEAKAYDKDGEKLKVRWDFGDGRRSYIWETRHKYTETGTYHASLRIQDESEEIIKNFTVKVKKYPKHKVTLEKIVPNPAGKDSGVEYIIIKNNTKKKIDLKNWSIATGSSEKKLANHPIREKLTIKPGKTKKITREHAAISLPNRTGVIEIRRPNSSVSDKQSYGDEKSSVPQNASYEKINGVWQWIFAEVENSKDTTQTAQIIAQALANENLFAQQLLESDFASDMIQNGPKENTMSTNSESNFISKLIQKVNTFLHKVMTELASLFKKEDPNQYLTNLIKSSQMLL